MQTADIIETKSSIEKELQILHKVAEYLSSHLSFEEILSKIVEIAGDLTSADSCFIFIYDSENAELTLKASKNPHPEEVGVIKLRTGEDITGLVAEEKTPILIPEKAYNDPRFKNFIDLPEDRFESILSIPLLFSNEIVGVINLQNIKPKDYSSQQIELLSTIGKYLGGAVKTALAESNIKKKSSVIDTLSKISNAIISDEYIKEMLQLIVAMTAEVLDSKICSIMMVDELKNELFIAATQSLSEEYTNKPNLKIGQSVSGKVVKNKTPITVLNVQDEKDYMYPDLAKKENIISLLSVPMMIKEKVVGVINSYTDNLHEFTEDEISILQSIANQAAVAIENTRLNEEILKAKDELETRKVIERAKGILMKELDVNEEEAYKRLQKKSMDLRKSMRDLSEAIVVAFEMKGN